MIFKSCDKLLLITPQRWLALYLPFPADLATWLALLYIKALQMLHIRIEWLGSSSLSPTA